jgi:uncharacterized protein (DUF486 family)
VNPPTPQADAESARIPVPLEHRMTTYRAIIAVLWTLAILTLCWLPGDVVRVVEKDSSWFQIPNLDKLVHWGIFVLFALLWLRVGTSRWRFLWVGLGGLVMAVVTEVVQTIPIIGRDGSLDDGVTDCIGVLIGFALAPALEPLLRRVESRIFRRSSS